MMTTELVIISALIFATSQITTATVENRTVAYICKNEDKRLYFSGEICNNLVAEAIFRDTIASDGFTYLDISTEIAYSDEEQAYAAGYVEGVLTSKQILQTFENVELFDYNPSCEVAKFITKNYEYLKETNSNNKNDSYWHQIDLLLYQIKGMEDGYYGNPLRVSNNINPLGLFWLYNWQQAELPDLQQKFGEPNTKVLGSGSCSAMVKNLGSDLIATHVTWADYSTMLRTMKRYNLNFRYTTQNSSPIPVSTIVLSSYPGMIQSADDYYITNQRMVILETTNEVYNASLWDYVTPTGTVPYFLRVTVANRLSNTSDQWCNKFRLYNNGLYNNQWMVIDYKLFEPDQPIKPKTMYVLEQLPGNVVYKDMSHTLNSTDTAWTSYNIPYFEEIQQIDNITAYINAYGDFFSHDNCPRAKIFKRDVHKVVDVDSAIALMRYNDFQNDPYAKCNCTPLGYSAENGISARCELNPLNGTYSIASEGARCHGATDLKITNWTMVDSMQMVGISGPTYQQQPVFDWSLQNDTACRNVKHEGHPTKFQFPPVLIDL